MKQDNTFIKIAKLLAIIIIPNLLIRDAVISLFIHKVPTDSIVMFINICDLIMGILLGIITYLWIKDSKNGKIIYSVIAALIWITLHVGFSLFYQIITSRTY